MRGCSRPRVCSSREDCAAICAGPRGSSARRMQPASGRSRSPTRTSHSALERRLIETDRTLPAAACTSAARATIRCSRRCGSICEMRSQRLAASHGAPSSRRSSRSRTTQGDIAPAGLHAHAAGHAELASRSGRAASRRSCATIATGLERRRAARGAEPARLGGRLRRAGARRSIAKQRARRSALPRVQSPSRPCSSVAARPRPRLIFEIDAARSAISRRLATDLLLFYTERVRLRRAARRDDDGLVDHAAEAQPRRLRARARRAGDRGTGALDRGARASRRSCPRATIAICSGSRRRCSAASIWPTTVLAIMAHALAWRALSRREDLARARALRGRARERARRRAKACRSARPTGASPPSSPQARGS